MSAWSRHSALAPRHRGVEVGTRVAWQMQQGTYATHAVAPADALVPLPDAIDDRTAAAVMLQGLTAQAMACSAYEIQAGETALVHAAAGGVGGLLTQIATARGARVIGTVSTSDKVEPARKAGATDVIVRSEQDVAAVARSLTDGRGVDVVFDGIGKATFDEQPARAAPARLPDPVRRRQRRRTAGGHPHVGPRRWPVPHARHGRAVRDGPRAAAAPLVRAVQLDHRRTARGQHRSDLPAGRRGPGPRGDGEREDGRQAAALHRMTSGPSTEHVDNASVMLSGETTSAGTAAGERRYGPGQWYQAHANEQHSVRFEVDIVQYRAAVRGAPTRQLKQGPPRVDPVPSTSRNVLILVVCCMSLALTGMDVTLVNLGLPAIQEDLHASLSDLQWTIDNSTSWASRAC